MSSLRAIGYFHRCGALRRGYIPRFRLAAVLDRLQNYGIGVHLFRAERRMSLHRRAHISDNMLGISRKTERWHRALVRGAHIPMNSERCCGWV